MIKKKPKNNEIKRLRFKFFITWLLTLIFPIIVVLSYNIAIHGKDSIKEITNPNFFNDKVFQIRTLNGFEYFIKEINNTIIEKPSLDDMTNLIENFNKSNFNNFDFLDTFLIIKKNNNLEYFKVLNGKFTDDDIDNFKTLEKNTLPKFKSGKETNNEEIFNKTGYVVARQIDFYFNDDSKGSIFIFKKYTNIRAKIANVVGKNLLFLVFVMLSMHSIFAYKMSKKFTQPVENMIIATNEVKNGNYKHLIQFENDFILNELSSSLNDMIRSLDEANDYRIKVETTRNDFINSLSHDLKTPLTSIKIHIEALRDGIANSPEKMDKYIKNILIKIQDLNNMFDELKVFNELDSNNNNYIYQNVDISLFLNDIIDELKYEFEKQNVNVNFKNLLEDKNTFTKIDIDKIKRVIFNIVTNSIKYANTKYLSIEIKLEDKNENEFYITIKDNGVGIELNKADLIFDKYYRIDESRNQNTPGSGLGLAIAKTIVDNHNGKIYVNTKNKVGLEIKLELKKVNI
ncbi:HAMP domain-containing sensor histidine kinase [Helicovermis profundi]|uniref:histidine kinase n=1 Tax=Helicovermis profundi TaxID=3065157 RepID=A0AAU9E2C9_9FIRM|nr:HAMP domain-containing sensor histidine kinase [Clostridia bacterium S502]